MVNKLKPMDFPARVSFRLSAQRALLGHVTPPLRSVSLAVNEPERAWRIRFVFDGQPSESELDAARCAVAEIVADFPDWSFDEEFLFVPEPGKIEDLESTVFRRCEDGPPGAV
jgi:hypothetical protein